MSGGEGDALRAGGNDVDPLAAGVTRPCTFVQHVHIYNELENKCTFSGYPDGKMFLKIIIKDLSSNHFLSNYVLFFLCFFDKERITKGRDLI